MLLRKLIGRPASRGPRTLLALMACLVAADLAIFFLARQTLLQIAWAHNADIAASLLPGAPRANNQFPFKTEIISYVLAQLIFFGSIALIWTWALWRKIDLPESLAIDGLSRYGMSQMVAASAPVDAG